MAPSVPQYPSTDHFIFCNEHCEFPTPIGGGGTMCVDEEGLPFFDNNAPLMLLDNMVLPETDLMPSYNSTIPFPEQFGVSSDMAVPMLAELNNGLRGINIGGISSESFESSTGSGVYYMPDVCQFGEEYCNAFVPDYQDVYHSSNDNWGFQQITQVPAMEEPGSKVGKYTAEERKNRILRYLKKRNQRNFNKTIKYECRKTLADKRVRVRGRFARNNELLCEGDQAVLTKKNTNHNNNDNTFHEDDEGFYDDEKIKHDSEDEWLQEAIASLAYLPYISG